MVNPMLLAVDLDGTIIQRGSGISAQTIAAIEQWVEAGNHFTVVTGRPWQNLPTLPIHLLAAGLVSCSNGALVRDARNLRVTQATNFSSFQIERILLSIEQLRVPFGIRIETNDGLYADATFLGGRINRKSQIVSRGQIYRTSLSEQVVKVSIRVEGSEFDATATALATMPEGTAELSWGHTLRPVLDMAPPQITKATALEYITALLGVDSGEVLAFGDMPSDLPMVQWAGVGYIMADGNPDAIRMAPRIAPPCAEDGVASIAKAVLGSSR